MLPPDDIVNRFELKFESQSQRPFLCKNVSLRNIFPTLLHKKNMLFNYMKRDCETQILQSTNIRKSENGVEEPLSHSYSNHDDYFHIICLFALFCLAASPVNVIVNFTILRKANGNGLHLCYGIFFPAFALRAVYGDIQRDQDILAEVIFLKTNEIDKKSSDDCRRLHEKAWFEAL
ncbi:hypothetical protein JTB14_024704 [Gonioctena quinquepunctata]|nr:hypothetical protein JTB14_024704 [Gonioctena quinquepunctata]